MKRKVWEEARFQEGFRAGLGLVGHMEEVEFGCEKPGGPGNGFEQRTGEVGYQMM